MSSKLRLLSVTELSFSAYITDISLTITSLNTQNICFRLFKRVQMQESSQDYLMFLGPCIMILTLRQLTT